MFEIFKSKEDKLKEKYKKLMEESFLLSSKNRTAADQKAAEADLVLKELEGLKRN